MAKSNSEYWEERIAANTWNTYNSLEDRNRKLLELYQDASRDIRNELYALAEKHSKDGVLSRSDMYKQNRLTEINRKFEQTIKQLGIEIQEYSTVNMRDGFNGVYQSVMKELGAVQVKKLNADLMEELLDRPWSGDSFSGRLWKNQEKLAASLNSILLTGLQQGKTVFDIASMLNGIMNKGFNAAHTLVRTETMHYLNHAALQGYQDAGCREVQVWAALDERTCKTCGSYHGKVYPIDKCPVIPFHANCRCTIIPCFDEKLIEKYERNDKVEQFMGAMKLSIPENVYRKSGMSGDTRDKINRALKSIEKEYNVYIDKVEGEHTREHDIFLAGGFIDSDGVLRHSIVFNYNIDYKKVEKRMQRMYNTGEMAGKNYEDYITHEVAHILPFQNCVTADDYYKLRSELKNQFVSGISGYADRTKDGAESLAEAFVRYRNGEDIPDESKKLIEKYIIPWRR